MFCIYLRYDSDPVSQVMQPYCGDIYIINEDATFSSFNYSKKAVCQA